MKKCFALLLGIMMLVAMSGTVFADNEITPNTNTQVVRTSIEADIVFFIDASGSMQEEIDGVRDNVAAFAQALNDKGVNARFSVIDFRDNYTSNGYDVAHIMHIKEWTTSASDVRNYLSNVKADGDESISYAIENWLTWESSQSSHNFREGSHRFGFLLTDEPNVTRHDYFPTERYRTMDDIIPSLIAKNIQLSVITAQDLKGEGYYRSTFTKTEGVYIDINRPDYYKSMLDIATWITEQVLISPENRLPYTLVETVPASVTDNPSIMNSIADAAGISSGTINKMTTENVNLFDISLPHDLTAESKDAYESQIAAKFVTKIDTVNLYSTSSSEMGYFLLGLTVPDALRSQNLAIGNSTTFSERDDGFIDFAIFSMTGTKLTRLDQSEVLILLYGKANETITLYLVKSDSDGTLRLWSADTAQFGEYIEENKTTIEKLKEDVNTFTDNAIDGMAEIVQDVKNLFSDDGDGSSGCNSGMGIAALITLAGMYFRKR